MNKILTNIRYHKHTGVLYRSRQALVSKKGQVLVSREWHIDDYVERLKPVRMASISTEFVQTARRHEKIEKHDVTDELLEECYVLVAKIVDCYGDAYLPIFERLHYELEQRRKQKDLINIAKRISKGEPTL